MKRIWRDRGTAISVWITKSFPRLVSRYTNTLRICFMYCTNIRIKKKKTLFVLRLASPETTRVTPSRRLCESRVPRSASPRSLQRRFPPGTNARPPSWWWGRLTAQLPRLLMFSP